MSIAARTYSHAAGERISRIIGAELQRSVISHADVPRRTFELALQAEKDFDALLAESKYKAHASE